MQVARGPLPDGDDEARPEEDADLAELDLLARRVVPRGAQDHEMHVAVVLLHLRPQAVGLRVLDGELVQPEADADRLELVRLRVDDAEPDESVRAAPQSRLVGRDRSDVLAPAVEIVGAIGDHRGPLSRESQWRWTGKRIVSTLSGWWQA